MITDTCPKSRGEASGLSRLDFGVAGRWRCASAEPRFSGASLRSAAWRPRYLKLPVQLLGPDTALIVAEVHRIARGAGQHGFEAFGVNGLLDRLNVPVGKQRLQ